jgi:ubiquinone/menaquinone biosynthesis C-methylase UbiE
MNLYNKFVLPRLLSRAMDSADIKQLRPGVIAEASGIVLEIGVGPGYNFPFYRNISKLYALDSSAEMIARAQKRSKELAFPVEFIQASAERIPLADASVDTVVSTWTLCSIQQPAIALQEIYRVLRPGGTFVFIDHGVSPVNSIAIAQTLATPFMRYFTGNCHLSRDIVGLIREARLEVKSVDHPRERHKLLIYNYRGIAIRPYSS